MSLNRCGEAGWVRVGLFDDAERRSLWVRYTKSALELCSGREGDDAYARVEASDPAFGQLYDVISRAVYARDQLIRGVASRLIYDPSPLNATWSDDILRDVDREIRCRCSPTHDHEHGEYLTSEVCPFENKDKDWRSTPNTAWAQHLAGNLHIASMLGRAADQRAEQLHGNTSP